MIIVCESKWVTWLSVTFRYQQFFRLCFFLAIIWFGFSPSWYVQNWFICRLRILEFLSGTIFASKFFSDISLTVSATILQRNNEYGSQISVVSLSPVFLSLSYHSLPLSLFLSLSLSHLMYASRLIVFIVYSSVNSDERHLNNNWFLNDKIFS